MSNETSFTDTVADSLPTLELAPLSATECEVWLHSSKPFSRKATQKIVQRVNILLGQLVQHAYEYETHRHTAGRGKGETP